VVENFSLRAASSGLKLYRVISRGPMVRDDALAKKSVRSHLMMKQSKSFQ